MTKADLVEQVAEAIGPGITKKDCALVVDGLLNAIKNAMAFQHAEEARRSAAEASSSARSHGTGRSSPPSRSSGWVMRSSTWIAW